MVKSCRKTKSKRITCHKRFKIIKKAREHNRQIKRDKRKNPQKFRRKDPGIPNSLPFKEDVLKYVRESKELDARRRLECIARSKAKPTKNLKKERKSPAARSFASHFNNVINRADILIEVLDARDPLGSRCLEAEKKILSAGKKLILLLNKIDLVPPHVAKDWLNYFRKWYTAMPFKANLQQQLTNLSLVKGKIPKRNDLCLKQGLGVDGLTSLLANLCRNHVGRLIVGFVGIPNSGKSAVINTLLRRKVAKSSSIPGLTREPQIFNLDSKLSLLDSPGIVLSKSATTSDLILRNCTKPEDIKEPEEAVCEILKQCPKRQMIVQYAIAEYSSTQDFLSQLAQRMGRLKKGAIPDSKSAARVILSDWMTGKLSHYTLPPVNDAPIAEPALPNHVIIDSLDFNLHEFDEKTFSALPQEKMDSTFCPAAVVPASIPFSEFDETVSEPEISVVDDVEDSDADSLYDSADEDSPMDAD